jgi:phosphoribosylformimino-5-aminoimidazole carboxamide ribotide isomerase
MLVIPAIDLKNGRCVRLRQGDMSQETRYSDDPPAMALQWQTLGAECLHIVDLDGAIEGAPKHMHQVQRIAKILSIPIQVGGGIRSFDTVRRYLSEGVNRIVLGTAALEDTDLIEKACQDYPGRILIGIDSRQGQVAVRGWKDVSQTSPDQLIQSFSQYPLGGVIFTDISRDGMLTGPNLKALQMMATLSPFPLIASGGVTKVEDIQAIGGLGPKITGIIIGKALYEGAIDLKAAIQVAQSSFPKSSLC